MKIVEVKVPSLGESIKEITLISWQKNEGDFVLEGEELFSFTCKYVDAEIPSPITGKLIRKHFNDGETVLIGKVVAVIQLINV